MCKFFSLISDPDTKKIMYFDFENRKKILSKEIDFNADSHTSIATFYGYVGKKEDSLNKYEYNPITKVFVVDQINNIIDDSEEVKRFCEELDFRKIVKLLVIKKVVYPFSLPKPKITETHLQLLKKWASVWASEGDSMWASVGASVWASVGDSVWDSVKDLVWASVWDSVKDSVWASEGASVWASVGDSVEASVWAYFSSFFNVKDKSPYSPAVELWETGLVASFHKKTWRLHGGRYAEILWEGEL